jgi:phytoene synthase
MARKTSFYYSFLVLPRAERRAIVAVWDFCRAVDDAVDEPEEGRVGQVGEVGRVGQVGQVGQVGTEGAQREAIRFWREELARCYGDGVPRTPQGQRLQPFIAPFDLPRQAFDDVIDGVAMDISTTRYDTFEGLLEYCHRVASAVGMICVRIFGCRGEGARQYALDLGVALQLTNIIRDVADDLDRGRVYLPLEDLATAGCTVDDLGARRLSDPVRRLIELECRRAHDFYDRAARSRPAEDRRRLVAAEIMRAVYFETLRRIERRGYDVFAPGLRVPRPKQAAIALRQWLWVS